MTISITDRTQATFHGRRQEDGMMLNQENLTGIDPTRTMLPLPPKGGDDLRFEMEVYARFMRHLRQVPGSRIDIKILSAIEFTADMMDHSDALIAKTLVDLGLRAPRRAFPSSFVDFADRSLMREAWDFTGAPPPAVMALSQHWQKIGEGSFSSGNRTEYAVSRYQNYVTA